MENPFLPQGYVTPTISNDKYINKFDDGSNRFRIMGNAVVGYEYWTMEDKPIRSKSPFTETPNIKPDKNGKTTVKYFWAFVVWDYKTEKIKIMQIGQKTIQLPIIGLIENPEWGDPKKYDISVNKTNESGMVKYSVTPSPHKPISQEINSAYSDIVIDLEQLFTGGDPFAGNPEAIPSQAQQTKERAEIDTAKTGGIDVNQVQM